VPSGDSAALATALVEAGGPRTEQLRAAGIGRAAECTWEAVGREYLDLYRSAIHAASAGPAKPVEIVVVAYGAPALLRAALEPVAGLSVTVVDNSSLPEVAALCDELGVRYIDSGRNRGFGGAVNIALGDRLPDADVLLLNPDARIEPDQIVHLQRALHAAPDLASVGPEQSDGDGHRARVLWPFPSPLHAWLEAVGLARLQRGPRFVIGSVLLLRAEAIRQVGGFDERFFLYAEETDWAYRASLLGWRHDAVASVHALHVGGGTSADSTRRELHFHASQERYLRKHHGAAGWQSARLANWLGAMLRSVVLPAERGLAARRRAALYRLGPVRVEARLTGRRAS
jgi:GT2 family glycosyltransferase